MRRNSTGVRLARFIVALAVPVLLVSCKPINEPKAIKSTPVSAPAVEATLAPTGGEVAGPWPSKVGVFASSYKGQVWYPLRQPSAMRVVSLDVIELEPGSGLVCVTVWSDGKKAVQLMQGSPKSRSGEIDSAGKVAWGSEKADIVRDDPTDSNSAVTIVYFDKGTLAELSGEASLDELKAVAASMKPVANK